MDLVRAITATGTIVRGVKPDQLDDRTPCRDWDVRTLTNHLLQVVTAVDLAGRGEPVPNELWERQLPTDDAAARFEDAARSAATAWDPLPETVHMGESDLPAPFAVAMLGTDLVIHGWDLARATGQDYRVDDDLAEQAYRFVAGTAEQGRGMGIFGEPVPVDGGAPLDRALGLSGRDPGWSPGSAAPPTR